MMYPTHSNSKRPATTTQNGRACKTWVAICYDESSGELLEESSPNMITCRNDILFEAKQKFWEHIGNEQLPGKGKGMENTSSSRSQSRMARRGDEGEVTTDIEDGIKRSRSATIPTETSREPTPRPRKAGKKSKGRNKDPVSVNVSFSSEHDDIPGGKIVQYTVCSTDKWEKWMLDALCALQQLGCRTMAKEWIKAIHPKKQSTHPYNGKNPLTGEAGDPDDNKPPYWPADVIHKEPDHIPKEARVKLLLHLLMKTPHKVQAPRSEAQSGKEIGARELMNALHGKFDNTKYGLKDRKSILQNMIEVRSHMEQYMEGGLNRNTVLGVPDYSSFRKNNKDDEDGSDDAVEDALEVMPGYGDYDEDGAGPSAPSKIDTQKKNGKAHASPEVPAEEPVEQAVEVPIEVSDETRGRKARRKSRRATAPADPDLVLARAYPPWSPSRLPPDYRMESVHIPGFDGMTHQTVDNNGLAMAQQMQQPIAWDPMNGSMAFPTQFHDPSMADQRIMTNMNVDPSIFMSREYAMMPQQQFCGGPPHPYFHHSPDGGMPFGFDPTPMQGFDQAQNAYYPPSSRPPQPM